MEAKIKRILAEETTIAGQLIEILVNEQAALTHDDVESLHKVLEEKGHAISRLEVLSEQRERLQSETTNGKTLVHQSPQWNQLVRLIRRCSDLNQINGRIVVVNRNRASQALSILKGGTGSSDTYSAKGEASTSHARHAITQA